MAGKFKETIKNLAKAVRDQGKGRTSFFKPRKKKAKPLTAAEKRLLRLRQGQPLKDGRTVKETKTSGSGGGPGRMLARAIMDRASKREQKNRK